MNKINKSLFLKLFEHKLNSFDTEFDKYWSNHELVKKYYSLEEEWKQGNKITKEIVLEAKLKIHKQIIEDYYFDKHYENIYSVLEYKDMGPCPKVLLDLLESKKVFDFSINTHTNPWATTWGIFKGNKIIISTSTQNFEIQDETSIISDLSYSPNKNKVINKNISNNVRISTFYKKWVYFEECERLEFNFQDDYLYKSKFMKRKNDEDRIKLENKEFENLFKWRKNDDVQFRMIFTPLAQETYVKEVVNNMKLNSLKNVAFEDRLLKIGKFFSNEFEATSNLDLYINVEYLFKVFATNPQIKLFDFLYRYKRIIRENVFNEFKNLKPLWLIPIFESVDNSNIINKVLNEKRRFEKHFIFYILSSIIKKDYNKFDTLCFYQELESKAENGVCYSLINSISFEHICIEKGDDKKWMWRPHNLKFPFFWTLIDQEKEYYRPIEIGLYIEQPKLKNKEVIKTIIEADDDGISFYIQNGFVVCIYEKEDMYVDLNLKQKMKRYIQKIKEYYSK